MPGRSVGGGGGHHSGGNSHRSSSSHHSSSHHSSYHSSSHHHSSYGRGYGSYGGYNRGYSSTSGASSCSGSVVLVIFIIIILFVVISRNDEENNIYDNSGTSHNSYSYSAHKYTKLNISPSVHNTEYIVDNAKVITDERSVLYALKYFEDKTGICPVLVTEKYFNKGTSYTETEMENFVVSDYNTRFDDGEHMLFYYFSKVDAKGVMWAETGEKADYYMDNNAWNILFDEVEVYLKNDQPQLAFTKGFMNAADKLSK